MCPQTCVWAMIPLRCGCVCGDSLYRSPAAPTVLHIAAGAAAAVGHGNYAVRCWYRFARSSCACSRSAARRSRAAPGPGSPHWCRQRGTSRSAACADSPQTANLWPWHPPAQCDHPPRRTTDSPRKAYTRTAPSPMDADRHVRVPSVAIAPQ